VRIRGSLLLNREEARRSVAPICRGSIIGFIVGALPGAGTTIATMMSYAAEVRISRHPELFGKGAIEGVAGPEAANNSASMGAMVPMLALGIPGSATTAVLLGALIMYGIQPGPLLFTSQSSVVWPLVDSMYIGNLMLIVLALPLVGLFVRLLYVPAGILFPLILVFGVVGVYAVAGSTFSLILLLGFGLFGYLLKKCDVPVAPLILALVLGDKIEQSFRQSLALSGGNPSIFFASPLAIVLWLLTIGSIGVSLWWLLRSRVGKVSAASATTEMASE
jgi:putative tricarboxylic transport membrane protein